MKIRIVGSVALLFVLLATVATATVLGQAAKKDDTAQNIQGTIQTMNKEASTITVRVGTAARVVSHNASTKFLYGHSNDSKAGTLAAIKEGFYISCAGTFDSKGTLMAKECIYRESR